MTHKPDWEQVASGAARLHVPGGWLYFVQCNTGGAAACFVPDKDAGKLSWRNTPIAELELSVRAHHALINDRVETVGDLMDKRDHELMRLPNFGRKSLREVREALERFLGQEEEHKVTDDEYARAEEDAQRKRDAAEGFDD